MAQFRKEKGFAGIVESRRAEEFAGTVDFGVLTVREDELEAMAEQCSKWGMREYFVTGRRQSYLMFDMALRHDLIYRLVLARSIRQGAADAQTRTRNIIDDFDPSWLMLVGIAGAPPSDEFTLGDVVVATELNNFSVRATVFGKPLEYRLGGGRMARDVEDFIALLAVRRKRLGNWNEKEVLGLKTPRVDPSRTYGDRKWRKKVRDAIRVHFRPSGILKRNPRITTRSFAGGDTLVKDDATWKEWQAHARQIEAVEMELPGVYEAAHAYERTYPILVSKGISDIVGLRRDDAGAWTKYACATSAAGALAMLSLRPVGPRGKPDLQQKPVKLRRRKISREPATSYAEMRAGLIHEFYSKRNRITAKIHAEFSLGLDHALRDAFGALNARRESQGLQPYFAARRFRLICQPEVTASGIQLDLAPIDFVYRALLEEQSVEEAVKEHVRTRIQEMARRIPEHLQGTHPTFNPLNYHPLGVEFVIITKDGKTLLRRRGKSVLLAREEWDVSFSGYCGDGDMDKAGDGTLDLSLTARHELDEEIGLVPAEPGEIAFTGIHLNAATGATDVLGVWPIQSRTEELVGLLADRFPGLVTAFHTTKKAEESFVWDTSNMIVDFNDLAISTAIRHISKEEGHSSAMMPEALVCLMRALEVKGKSTTELMGLFEG